MPHMFWMYKKDYLSPINIVFLAMRLNDITKGMNVDRAKKRYGTVPGKFNVTITKSMELESR